MQASRPSSAHERLEQGQGALKSRTPALQAAAASLCGKVSEGGTLAATNLVTLLRSRPAAVKGKTARPCVTPLNVPVPSQGQEARGRTGEGRHAPNLQHLAAGVSAHDLASDLEALRTELGSGTGLRGKHCGTAADVPQPSTAFFRDLLVSHVQGGR